MYENQTQIIHCPGRNSSLAPPKYNLLQAMPLGRTNWIKFDGHTRCGNKETGLL